MGIFDQAKDAASNAARENPDAVDNAVDRGADFADERTGGQHSEHIDKGADAAKEHAGNFLGNDQDQQGQDQQQGQQAQQEQQGQQGNQ